jgi:hypothetical protein
MLDKLKNMGPREKLLASMVVATILLPLIGTLVVVPANKRYRVLDAAILVAEAQRNENGSFLQKKLATEQQYDAIRGHLAKATIAAEDIDEVKGEIDDLATRTHVSYGTMSHREPVAMNEFCDEYIVEIGKFKTDMQNLLVFLREIRATPGMLRVAGVRIKPVKGESTVTGSILISKVMIADPETRKPDVEPAAGEEQDESR